MISFRSQLQRFLAGHSLFTASNRRRKTVRNHPFEAEKLESRTLLTQIVSATVNNAVPAVGDSIEVTVNYDFTDGTRAQSQSLNVQMHFNSQELEFVGFKTGTYEIDGKVEPANIIAPSLNDDTAAGENKDTDSNTDTFIKSVWNVALGNWPGTVDTTTGNRVPNALPDGLYVAQFTVKAGFDGESINFTGTPQGGQQFQGTSLQLDAAGGPTQSVSPVASSAAVAVGDVFDVTVPYDISEIARAASQSLNVQMHFNSQELEFVGFKAGTYEIDGKVEPANILAPSLNDDTAAGENKDNDANTDTFIKSVWNVALGNWPGTVDTTTGNRVPNALPDTLYVAQFRAKAGFDGETIRFTGTPQGGARFDGGQPVAVALGAANNAPVAQDDSFTVIVGTPLTGNVITNTVPNGADSDPDTGDTLAISTTAATAPTKGSVTLTTDGGFTYTANAGETGTDTFTYTLNDGQGGMDTGTVTITLTPPTPGTFDFDVDGNGGDPNPFTDAVLVFAWMSPGTPDATFQNFIDPTGTRNTPAAVKQYLDDNAALLDIDGNGERNPFTDAVLIFADQSPGTPDATYQNFIATSPPAAADRDTAAEIRAYFDSLEPVSTSSSSSTQTQAMVFAALEDPDSPSLLDLDTDEYSESLLAADDESVDLVFAAADDEVSLWKGVLGF